MPVSETPNSRSTDYEVRFTHQTGVEVIVKFGTEAMFTEAQIDQVGQNLLDLVTGWSEIDPLTTPYAFKYVHTDYSVTPTP